MTEVDEIVVSPDQEHILIFPEYHRPLEMEREANKIIKASHDLGEISLGNGEKMSLSIIKVDDFPSETSDETVTTEAYLLRRVYAKDGNDLSEFQGVGEDLELRDADNERLLYAIEELNLPLTFAVSTVQDEHNQTNPPEWKKKCSDPPLLIGITGDSGKGKTQLMTYFLRNNVPPVSFDEASGFDLYEYMLNTDHDNIDAGAIEKKINELRTGPKKIKKELPHYATRATTTAKAIDEGRYNNYLFIETPPDWKHRAKKGVSPDPDVFDMFVSSLDIVINISSLVENETITEQEMEDVLEYVKSEEFKEWVTKKKARENKIRAHVIQTLQK